MNATKAQQPSLSNSILQYIARQPKERLPTLSPADIAAAIGAPTEQTGKLLWSLEHTGRIALMRDGRSVVGIREITRLEGRQGKKIARPIGEPPKPREAPATVKTPLLDKYLADKDRASEINRTMSGSGYLSVQFNEVPEMEEALRLRDALVRAENNFRELSSQYKMLVYQKQKMEDDTKYRVAKKVAESQMEAARD